jgi:hypothetical protein
MCNDFKIAATLSVDVDIVGATAIDAATVSILMLFKKHSWGCAPYDHNLFQHIIEILRGKSTVILASNLHRLNYY